MIPEDSKNPWLKPLDARVWTRGRITQQTDGTTIHLRVKPLPWRTRNDPTVLDQSPSTSTTTTSTTTSSTTTTSTTTTSTTTTTTSTTTTSTTPPPFDVSLFNGDGGNVTCFDGTCTGTNTIITGVSSGTHSLTATPGVGFVFVNWTASAGSIADASNPSTTIDLTTGATITSNFEAG